MSLHCKYCGVDSTGLRIKVNNNASKAGTFLARSLTQIIIFPIMFLRSSTAHDQQPGHLQFFFTGDGTETSAFARFALAQGSYNLRQPFQTMCRTAIMHSTKP